MRDIDEMDMIGFIEIRSWSANKERYRKLHPPTKKAYIDDVWPHMKPI